MSMYAGRASKRTRFRVDDVNAAGGKPLAPQVKEYQCVTATQIHTSNAKVGDHAMYDIAAYNTPLDMVDTLSFVEPTGISAVRHPSGHQAIILDGYDTHLVLKSRYVFHVKFHGSNVSTPVADRNKRMVFAYKFSLDPTVDDPAFPATVATTEAWLDMQASVGWKWKMMPCDWDTGDPKAIVVDVPNVVQMMKIMRKNQVTQLTMGDFTGVISDSSVRPVAGVLLHFVLFLTDRLGIPATMGTGWASIGVRCTQTVRVWKAQAADEMIDEGDDA